jgi:hypothetical protein
MAIKDKKHGIIKEILKSAGTLDSSAIKIRVCERLGIDPESYPKSTFQRHLQELVNDGEIIAEEAGGKNNYKLDYDGSDVIGHKYLEKIGGAIHVPKMIQAFGVRISEGITNSESERDVFIVLEIAQNFFTLIVPKDAMPFNVHLSRIQPELEKHSLIAQVHGSRTICLELQHPRLSGFKKGDNKKSGHLLMKFERVGEMILEDLGSSNGSSSRALTSEGTYNMVLKANENTKATQQEKFLEEGTQLFQAPVPLMPYQGKKTELPQLAICSGCINIVVFSHGVKKRQAG